MRRINQAIRQYSDFELVDFAREMPQMQKFDFGSVSRRRVIDRVAFPIGLLANRFQRVSARLFDFRRGNGRADFY